MSPLRFDVVTIFPQMFRALLEEGVVSKGAEKGLIEIVVWDLREFTTDRHRSTDDEAYGGGAGMVMLAEPVLRCLDAIRAVPGRESERPWVIEMSPQGRVFDHADARRITDRD